MTPATNGVIERLLFVADFAVSEVDDLPVAARAVFDAVARIHVVTPRPTMIVPAAHDR